MMVSYLKLVLISSSLKEILKSLLKLSKLNLILFSTSLTFMIPEKYSELEARENLPFFENMSSLISIAAQEKRKKTKKRYQAKNDFFI
jgi:hypothetical protein